MESGSRLASDLGYKKELTIPLEFTKPMDCTTKELVDGSINARCPSFSRDGKDIAYRIWESRNGVRQLRILNLETNRTSILTNGSLMGNLPHYTPKNTKVILTWRTINTNYDVCTIPANTALNSGVGCFASSGAYDAHALRIADGGIMWSSGMYRFRAECATYDRTFQPYSQVMTMEADRNDTRMLIGSLWEDSMPLFVPNDVLVQRSGIGT